MANNIAARLVALLALASLSGLTGCKDASSPAAPHLKAAEDAFRKSDFAAAGAAFEQALQLDPKQDVKVWEKGAFAYMKAGNQDKAAELLEKSLGPNPSRDSKLETYRNIAGMYLQAQIHDKAERWFSEVVKLDPKDDQSLSWLAEIASIRGGARANAGPVKPEELDAAIARYDQVIALTPQAPGPYINKRIALGRYLGYLGEQKGVAERDAKESKDKQAAEALLAASAKFQARIDELRARLDETNKKLGEVQKAARARK